MTLALRRRARRQRWQAFVSRRPSGLDDDVLASRSQSRRAAQFFQTSGLRLIRSRFGAEEADSIGCLLGARTRGHRERARPEREHEVAARDRHRDYALEALKAHARATSASEPSEAKGNRSRSRSCSLARASASSDMAYAGAGP